VAPSDDDAAPRVLREVTAEVGGRRYEVKLWVPETVGVIAGGTRAGGGGSRPSKPRAAVSGTGSGTVTVPMQGTIVKVLVAEGDEVEIGQTLCVLEAMKMENAITAEKAGTVNEVKVAAGDSVGPGDVVAVID
jgi:acetyl-CoA/propionyl-CoA carboxylase biotin carboxyl carrier protein